MNVRFEVVVMLDHEQIAHEGKRRGYSLERARESVLADVECRLFDSINYRDGVARVGITLLKAPELTSTELKETT